MKRRIGDADRGIITMQLHFMIIGILLLTLMATYAIRRAEERMMEQRDVDRRAHDMPPT
jgi:hypothetical protein